jgi:hypothetical protein
LLIHAPFVLHLPFPFTPILTKQISKIRKKLQLQLDNKNEDRTRWRELETLAVENLGPATRHKEATLNSTSRELSSKAKAQNVCGIFQIQTYIWGKSGL